MKTVPFSLPLNWTWTTMGEIADVVGGGTPRTNDPGNYEGGTIPWITPADLSGYNGKYIAHGERYITEKGLTSSSAKMMPAGTILFSSRAPVGYVAIASKSVCTNQGFKSFVLKIQDILPDYVYWWLKGNKDLAESLASGTTFLELSGAKAKQLPIPVAPPERQRSIVAEIEKQFSRLDEAVASLKRTKANLKWYKASVLKAAVEGKLTEDWRKAHPDVEPASKLLERILAERCAKWNGRGEYKAPAEPDVSSLCKLPKSWIWSGLEQLTSAVRVICYGILMPKEHVPDGVPYVKVKDMKGDRVDVASLQRTSPKIAAAYARASLKRGDLLLAIRGTYGRVAEVPPELEGGNITQDTARLDVTPLVDHRYVAAHLRSEVSQAFFRRVARGVAVKGVNIGDVRLTPIALPPVAEQKEIVAEVERRLSVIEELEASVNANLTRADRLRQSILSQAFSGRLVGRNTRPIPDSLPPVSLAAERHADYGKDNRARR